MVDESYIFHTLLSDAISYTTVVFTKLIYTCHSSVVMHNPLIDRVKDGMHLIDYSTGFGSHNYGRNILLINPDHKDSQFSTLITWNIFTNNRMYWIHMWEHNTGYNYV